MLSLVCTKRPDHPARHRWRQKFWYKIHTTRKIFSSTSETPKMSNVCHFLPHSVDGWHLCYLEGLLVLDVSSLLRSSNNPTSPQALSHHGPPRIPLLCTLLHPHLKLKHSEATSLLLPSPPNPSLSHVITSTSSLLNPSGTTSCTIPSPAIITHSGATVLR